MAGQSHVARIHAYIFQCGYAHHVRPRTNVTPGCLLWWKDKKRPTFATYVKVNAHPYMSPGLFMPQKAVFNSFAFLKCRATCIYSCIRVFLQHIVHVSLQQCMLGMMKRVQRNMSATFSLASRIYEYTFNKENISMYVCENIHVFTYTYTHTYT